MPRTDPRAAVLTALPGAGPFTAVVIIAGAGDITRFPSARKLASRAGLTPTVRGSDQNVRHGHITKQRSPVLRRALNQAAQTARKHPDFAPARDATAARRGPKIAATAIARKLPRRSWHLLTEHEQPARPGP